MGVFRALRRTRLHRLLHGGELLIRRLRIGLSLLGRYEALPRQLFGVFLPDGWRLLDALVHHGLCVRRLVRLIVSVAPVPHEIDDDIGVEFLAIHHREPDGREARFRIVRIHVNDGCVEAFREIAGIVGRSRLARLRCEADLVVENQMDRAAGRIATEPREVERLGHDALAGERRIAVQQHRQRDDGVVARVRSVAIGLISARASLDDGVHRFEVARIGRQRYGDVLAVRGSVYALGAVMVFHVASAGVPALGLRGFLAMPALELLQDGFVRYVDHMGQHVEAATVRHPDDCLARAVCRGELDREVEHRHRHVETFDREPLLAEVRLVQEALERIDDGESRQQLLLSLSREWAAVLTRLDHLSQPHPLLVTADVLDFVRDRAAVGRAELRQRLGERAAPDVDAQHVGRNPGHDLGRECQPPRIE